MKVEYINPFIQSVIETFGRMLNCKVEHGKPIAANNDSDSVSLIGMVGLSGTAKGNIALKFPPETAKSVVGKLAGIECSEIDSSVIDGVGELINIIAGSSKAKMSGQKISISLPSVIKGSFQKLTAPQISYVSIPFSCNLGNFEVLISFSVNKRNKEEVMHESTNC